MGCSQGHDVTADICEAVSIHAQNFIADFFLMCPLVKGDQQEYPEEQRQCFKQRTLNSSIFMTIGLPFKCSIFSYRSSKATLRQMINPGV